MSRRGRGQPSKIDQVVAFTEVDGAQVPVRAGEKVVQLLAGGNYLETAAAAAGVSKESVYEWLRVGAAAATKVHQGAPLTAHDRRCLHFSDAVTAAQAQAEVDGLARITALAAGDDASVALRAEQWRMERRFAKRWGQRGSLEVTGPDGGAIGVDLGSSARELLSSELDRMAARLLAAPDPPPPGVAQPEEPTAAEG
jgi:transposase